MLTTTSDAVDNGEGANGYDPVAERAVYGPMLTLSEFKIRVSESIKEFFDSADADEVVRGIQEMRCKAYHPEVVKRAISLSLDEGPRERELVSRLLTCLHPIPLVDGDLSQGFDILLDSLDDLSIDIPDAKVRRECMKNISNVPVTRNVFLLTMFQLYDQRKLLDASLRGQLWMRFYHLHLYQTVTIHILVMKSLKKL